MFIYLFKNQDTFQKKRQVPLSFYSQKARRFTLRDFHDFLNWYL